MKHIAILVILLTLSGCLNVANKKGSGNDSSIDNSDNSNQNNDNSVDNGGNLGETNPPCLSVMGIDGAEGFKWKPISDSDGKAVAIFPAKFTERFEKVEVTTIDGKIELAKFSDFANGDRQHWRLSLEGSNYFGRIVAFSENGECVWEISDTSVEQD